MRVPDLTNIEPINEAHVRELQEQVVGVGSLFNRLYSIFESEGPELIAELRELLPKGVHADIHEVIHKMKGSSAAMGADRIYALTTEGVLVCRSEGEFLNLDGLADLLGEEYTLYCLEAKRFLS
ncbi:Hpt domain-containing protein [Candidatus Pelagisphaera phototrophica]|uniref:Hpt domain-containing protein n=1 Tax=Candidatus Pelagisphaera phototrophica TaxID=2684113 RepID=UPI0019E7C6B1|nr:Hpt domain-containing protein [Candidatus Pelagisphaera phototrophica]QXD31131.1 Hpt domain-containing protein [Candidatus Pelagisphaera phototrophica]